MEGKCLLESLWIILRSCKLTLKVDLRKKKRKKKAYLLREIVRNIAKKAKALVALMISTIFIIAFVTSNSPHVSSKDCQL